MDPSPHSKNFSRPEFWVLLALLGTFITGLPALLLLPASWTLFNPEAYKQELERSGFYDRYPLILGESFAQGGDQLWFGLGQRLLGALDDANYQEVIRLVFPETWVRSEAEKLIDQFWAYFNFQSEALRLEVDFRPVKSRLRGQENLQIVQAVVAGLPSCSQEQVIQMGLDLLRGNTDNLPLCRPPEQLAAFTNDVLAALLRGTSTAIPDKVNLAGALPIARMAPGGAVLEESAGRLFTLYRLLRYAAPVLAVTAVLDWIAVIYFARRTLRGPWWWGGTALLLTGFAALVILLLLALWNTQVLPLLLGRFFFTSLAVFEVIKVLAMQVAGRYLVWAGGISLGLLLAGLVFAGIGMYGGKRL